MIEQFSYAVLFAGGFLLSTFGFIEYVLWLEKKECLHQNKTTYDSYHKQVCIDCGEEFSTTEIKK